MPLNSSIDLNSVPEVLASCDAFVQVVGAWPGKKVDGRGLVQFQHDEAARSRRPSFVWRPPDAAPIQDDGFRNLLGGFKASTAANAEAFAAEVSIPEISPRMSPNIFVRAVMKDIELRTELRERLIQMNYTVLPTKDNLVSNRDPGSINKEAEKLNRLMLSCDAIVYLNGSGDPENWLDLKSSI